MRAFFYLVAFIVCLTGCAGTQSQLREGKANFREENYTEAFQQLRPIAEQGNADAQYAVGYMYYYGKGTERDVKQARKWVKAAAEQNQPNALMALRVMKQERKKSAPPVAKVPLMLAAPPAHQ